jgi:hypothetical protein
VRLGHEAQRNRPDRPLTEPRPTVRLVSNRRRGRGCAQRQDQFGRVVATGSKLLREPQHVCGVPDIRSVAVDREELLAAAGEFRALPVWDGLVAPVLRWSTRKWLTPLAGAAPVHAAERSDALPFPDRPSSLGSAPWSKALPISS